MVWEVEKTYEACSLDVEAHEVMRERQSLNITGEHSS